jgi:hypothetical protein
VDIEQFFSALAVLSARTDAAERKILAAAAARLEEVEARLEAIHPDAVLHVSDEYQALTLERGQLLQVIALALMALQLAGSSPSSTWHRWRRF